MDTLIKRVALLSLAASSAIWAAGYKIPEQSLNSTALSAAYVANANGADAVYYNPANMTWMDKSGYLEGALTYINLSSIKYASNVSPALFNGKTDTEKFLIPTFFYVAPKTNDLYRYGISLTAPAGLSKKWKTPFQKASAEEFSLKVLELNPSMAFLLSNKVSAAAGLRLIYSEGIVKSDSGDFAALTGDASSNIARDMEGDDIEFGYNLALSYIPIPDLKLAMTYRSKTTLNEEGNAKLYALDTKVYDGKASVEVVLPAVLSIAAAYTLNNTTLELTYERNYWSEYKTLDFHYSTPIGDLTPAFDDPIDKNWNDTNTFRIGITHKATNNLTLMAGYAIDKTPVPDRTLGFELPDSDAKIYSFGFDYKITNNLNIGLAYLYDSKENRSVSNPEDIKKPNGTFSDSDAYLITGAIKYRF